MQRRSFIINTALSAIAVSTTGFIRFNGTNFEGDCETTTDILGPFYRPNAPVRNNLLIKNAAGQEIILSGIVKHKDCIRPLNNACVELWHCSAEGIYDNESPEFLYRGKTFCDEKGNYQFTTVIPVPYGIGNGQTRPAHFHLMISAPGYQSLITQLYFSGDKFIPEDPSASLPSAKSRILNVKNNNGKKVVTFNVTMMEKLPADTSVIERLAGIYIRTDNQKKEEFYKKEDLLWIKNATSINGGYPLQYTGDNRFEYYGTPMRYQFTVLQNGSVKISYSGTTWSNVKESWEAIKENKL
jgi:protocatechuate 3,4-dioxygenase beta subunit